MPNFRNKSDYERKSDRKEIYGYSQWVGGRAVRDDLPESYSYTEETDEKYNQRRAGLLKDDIVKFATRMSRNEKKYDGFDDFIKAAQEQFRRLDNLLKSDLYKNIKEKQTMNKQIDEIICMLLATMDNVALYDDHLKAGAKEAVQSVEKMIDCVDATVNKKNDVAARAAKESAEFSQQALLQHKAAVQSGQELSSKEFEFTSNILNATAATLVITSLLLITFIILNISTFGALGMAALVGVTCAAAFYSAGYACSKANESSSSQHIVESMESAFTNRESQGPESSAKHMGQLGDTNTNQPVIVPTSTSTSTSTSTPISPDVNHTIQSDNKAVVIPTSAADSSKQPESPRIM